MISNLLRDLRQSARRLRKSPAFTLTAIVTLAIGIGANTAIFSMMDAIVLRPLNVPHLDRVMNITETPSRGGPHKPVALANYIDWKEQSRSFTTFAIHAVSSMTLGKAGEPAHVTVDESDPALFDLFQVRPLMGRLFTTGETTPGRDHVAVLSYGLWQQQFAGEPQVLGKMIELDHRKYTVIGVFPRTFRYPSIARLWIPLTSDPARRLDRSRRDTNVVAGLRPDVTIAQAQDELKGIAVRLERLYPATNNGWSIHIAPLLNNINGDLTPEYMRMVFGASGFLLLIICANLTNLQFARALSQRSELAIRSALGAGRLQLLRQLLTENLLLAACGAGFGLLAAQFALDRIKASMPAAVERYLAGWDNIHLNGRALMCACLVAILCAVLSGLAPAIGIFRVDLVNQLKSGSRSVSSSKGSNRLRSLFVVAQITFALTLVAGSALMVKGMWAMSNVTQSFAPEQQLVADVDLPHERYQSNKSLQSWFTASVARLSTLPGVTDVSTTTALPYGNGGPWVEDFALDEKPVEPGTFQAAQRLTVSPNYLAMFHLPVAIGRAFAYADGPETQPVAIVSRAFVSRYFGDRNPIGHKVRFNAPAETVPALTIVGVAEDVLYTWTDKYPEPAIYISANQFPSANATYVLHTRAMRDGLSEEVRNTITALDPALPVDRLQTYAAYLDESLTGLKYVVIMLLEDGIIALLLSSIGIFGVIAISVADRTREIGVRLALGAQNRGVIGLLFRRALVLTSAGLAIGIPLALGLTHVVSSLIYGVEPQDTSVLLLTSGLITAVTLGSSYLAARRAADVDMIQALQSQ